MIPLIFILYGLGALGVLGLFYLLKVPFNWFNIVMGALLVIFVGNHLFLLFLVGLGVLYVKQKFFPENENKKDGNNPSA